MLRPSILIGVVDLLMHSDEGRPESDSRLEVLISPGVTLLYDIRPAIYIGADARLSVVRIINSSFGFALYAAGGIRF
jgi:hypothetical protein